MKYLPNPLIVTRHKALVEVLLNDFGLVDVEIIEHATPEKIKGRNVIGILPIYLASLCDTITALNLNLPPELRGVELSEDQVREYMGDLTTYEVRSLE